MAFTSTSAPVGDCLTYAALWHDYQVKSCNSQTEDVFVHATDVHQRTGTADCSVTVSTTYDVTATTPDPR